MEDGGGDRGNGEWVGGGLGGLLSVITASCCGGVIAAPLKRSGGENSLEPPLGQRRARASHGGTTHRTLSGHRTSEKSGRESELSHAVGIFKIDKKNSPQK